MKKQILLLLSVVVCTISFSQEVPKLQNYVNDYAAMLSPAETNNLNTSLKNYQDSTSSQVIILTIPSFDDQANGPLFDYSLKVFRTWGVGQKSKNNGVLLVVVKNLASKNAPGLRIVTGYGAEGPLPDIICKEIIERFIRPYVNTGKYYTGIDSGQYYIRKALNGEFKSNSENSEEDIELILWIALIILVIIVFLFLWAVGGGSSSGSGYFSSGDSSSSSGGSGFDGGGGGSSGGGGAGD